MPISRKVKAGTHDYYVLIRWLPRENRYEGFMLSGRATRDEVRRGERFQRKRIRAGFRRKIIPSVYVGPKAEPRPTHWRKRWLKWTL
jgi:hypothetical protein